MTLLLALGAVATYVLAVVGVVYARDKGLVERFDAELASSAAPRDERGPFTKLLDAVGRRAGPSVLRTLGPERRERVQQRLDAAGRPGGMDLQRYAERRGAFLVLSVLLAALLSLQGQWYLTPPLLLLGFLSVDITLDGKGRRRQDRIDRDLPDFMDVLAVCVNAGIAFRPAIQRVGEATGGPLGEEVGTTLRQMALGSPRRTAFERLRERNPSEFMGAFVSSFLQAEELGVPLAEALRDLAADMRRDAFQRARRRAQNATPRVSLIVTTLIMPAAILLIVAGLVLGSDIDFGALTER